MNLTIENTQSTLFTGDLKTLLAPVGVGSFFTKYWESAPLHIARNHPTFYGNLVSIKDFDSLITKVDISKRNIRVGKFINQEENVNHILTDEQNIWRELYHSYGTGHSVALLRMEDSVPEINRLCRTLEKSFECVVTAGLYATPKTEMPGFHPHFDNCDVYICQLEGNKTWNIWDVQYPLPQNEMPTPDVKDIGTLIGQVSLSPGDLLYIPRGFIHQATAQGEPSLHLSLVPNHRTWRDLLIEAVNITAQDQELMRRSLPIHLFSKTNSEIEYSFNHILSLLNCDKTIQQSIQRIKSNILFHMHPIQDGHFHTLLELDLITMNSTIKKRGNCLYQLLVEDQQVILQFPGNSVSAPIEVEPLLEYIAEHEEFQPKDLPTRLPELTKLQVVKNLIREGFLTPVISPRSA